MRSNLFPIRSHLVHYVEDFVIDPKFFSIYVFSIYHHWPTCIFGLPALRYFTIYVFTTDHFLFWALSVRHFAEPFVSENLRFYWLYGSLLLASSAGMVLTSVYGGVLGDNHFPR